MKKRTMIALIVAAALIISGGVLAFAGLKSTNFDFLPEAEVKTYIVAYPFTSIQIDSGMCDVTLVKTEGDFQAVCPETEKLNYAVIVEDGVLKISAMDMRHWYDFINIYTADMEMTVYLPEDQYDSLYIQTDTGDIQVPDTFFFETAEVSSSTGDITFTAAVKEQFTVTTTSGDISVFGCSPAAMRVTATTGDIVLDEISGNCEFALHTTTGDVQAQNVSCEVMACETDTGNVSFYRVIAQGYLGLCSDTGDIALEDCDSTVVSVETDTGDVTGHFLTPKWFITDTSTGDVDIPFSREGGECRITTDTGDIKFH